MLMTVSCDFILDAEGFCITEFEYRRHTKIWLSGECVLCVCEWGGGEGGSVLTIICHRKQVSADTGIEILLQWG